MSFDALDITASGLYAQRVRMDTVSSNIANVNTTRNADGDPEVYIRKKAVFSAVYDDAIERNVLAGKGLGFSEGIETDGNFALKGSIKFNSQNVASGVEINSIEEDTKNPYKLTYDPGHPDSDENGFVKMPNINIVTEMVDMISASRAYEANVTTMNATKGMITSALKI
ncbi:MAG: flagellar basal body rod protein FlgC [Candidatus Gastranaerophilales bacterium]|nr:flagellar basal body rod protein FlgC [Candidatus Gastranaerophilales bacterium]